MFFNKNKAPVTQDSIPPIPGSADANKHFASLGAQAPSKSMKMNKKTLIALAVVLNVVLIGTVVFIGSKLTQETQTTDTNAQASSGHYWRGVLINSPVESLDQSGKYVTNTVIENLQEVPVTVTTRNQTHYCNSTVDPSAENVNCNENLVETNGVYELGPAGSANSTATISLENTNPAGACGSFQHDLYIVDVSPRPDCTREEQQSGRGVCAMTKDMVFAINSYANACTGDTPTPTVPAESITPSVTESPTPTLTITESVTPTESPTPTLTVTPSVTPTGTLTPTPISPTPTDRVVYITATPTPTGTVVVVNTTETPTAVPVTEDLPTVGNPLPLIAVILPAVLIALAFLL